MRAHGHKLNQGLLFAKKGQISMFQDLLHLLTANRYNCVVKYIYVNAPAKFH